ncbi:MAG: ABC transporter ATP-binding protein, partial [Muribaculaceae bacterium]|nr:ABC transporter ATP-binding protein [Muribaculaceae bacterium]
EEGRTILMVTHNEAQAELTHRVMRFFDGRQIS